MPDARIAAPRDILPRLVAADPRGAAPDWRWLVDLSIRKITFQPPRNSIWPLDRRRGANGTAQRLALDWLSPLARPVIVANGGVWHALWAAAVAFQRRADATPANDGAVVDFSELAPALAAFAQMGDPPQPRSRLWLRLVWRPHNGAYVQQREDTGYGFGTRSLTDLPAWTAKSLPALSGAAMFAVGWRYARLGSAHAAAAATAGGHGESRSTTSRFATDTVFA